MDMGHWIEPQVLGDAQKGYGNPIVTVPTHEQYIHSPPPGMAPPGVHHYINRPGQLQGLGAQAAGTIQRLLPGVMLGVVGYVLLAPWITTLLGKKTSKNPRRRKRRRKKRKR